MSKENPTNPLSGPANRPAKQPLKTLSFRDAITFLQEVRYAMTAHKLRGNHHNVFKLLQALEDEGFEDSQRLASCLLVQHGRFTMSVFIQPFLRWITSTVDYTTP
jgi:hypothetical protein